VSKALQEHDNKKTSERQTFVGFFFRNT